MHANYPPTTGPSTSATAVQRAEECVIGCLVNHGGEELPPSLLRLLEHSPDSFDDKRYGTIARVVFQLREAGKEVSHVTIRRELLDTDAEPELGTLALQLSAADMPVACADVDAGRCGRHTSVAN